MKSQKGKKFKSQKRKIVPPPQKKTNNNNNKNPQGRTIHAVWLICALRPNICQRPKAKVVPSYVCKCIEQSGRLQKVGPVWSCWVSRV